jgi:hypothetical protein
MDELLPWLKWGIGGAGFVGAAVWTLHKALNGKVDKDTVTRLEKKIDTNTEGIHSLAITVARTETLVKGFDKKLDRALEE